MGKLSRDKGKRWEREIAQLFREAMPGERIHRGWQARDGADAPDVVVPVFWIEAKVGKCPPVIRALEQATLAAPKGRVPIAVCKQDRCVPTVTMTLENFLEFVKEWWERK